MVENTWINKFVVKIVKGSFKSAEVVTAGKEYNMYEVVWMVLRPRGFPSCSGSFLSVLDVARTQDSTPSEEEERRDGPRWGTKGLRGSEEGEGWGRTCAHRLAHTNLRFPNRGRLHLRCRMTSIPDHLPTSSPETQPLSLRDCASRRT